jgi:hypothetical protein
MPPPKQPTPPEPKQAAYEVTHALVGAELARMVLLRLGTPPSLLACTARHVCGGHYRVNVVVGEHISQSRVAHSFFVEAGEDGAVLDADPPITRFY